MSTMRSRWILGAGLSLGLLAQAWGQDLDAAVQKMATDLGSSTTRSAIKKVSVLDFTDLQGNSPELGRFVAEQLSIRLVTDTKGLSVVTRAKMKTILEEHELTATGLVNPENVRKLRVSGVDAVIIGSITPLGETLTLTAQIISMETAEISGGATAKLTRTRDVDDLFRALTATGASRSTRPAGGSGSGPTANNRRLPAQAFGDLNVVIEDVRALDNQTIVVDVIFRNSGRKSVAAAMYAHPQPQSFMNLIPMPIEPTRLRASLTSPDGLEFACIGDENFTGMRAMRARPSNLTEIPPFEERKASFRFHSVRGNITALPARLRLQAEIVIDAAYSAQKYPANFQPTADVLPGDCRLHNLVVDVTE